MTQSGASDFGRLLRLWRNHARMSQLELATRAEMSQRHLSFIETGRARPGSDVVHRVGDALGLPLRDRNRLMAAAGLRTALLGGIARRRLGRPVPLGDPATPGRARAVPGLRAGSVVGRGGRESAGQRLFPKVGESYPNVVEAFLAPGGLREMVVNFPEVASMYLRRLEADVAEASDDRLQATLRRARELLADVELIDVDDASDLVICPRLRLGGEIVGTVTMVARFGATRAVTLDELRVELIFPADKQSDAWFRQAARADA